MGRGAPRYSVRRAFMGSMLAARLAGMKPAMAAKADRITTAAASVDRIISSDAVELTGHQVAAQQRDRDTDGQPESYLPGGGPEHESDNIATVGAESHAHADFAGAAGHGVGSNSIQTDRRQDERQQSEQSGQAA